MSAKRIEVLAIAALLVPAMGLLNVSAAPDANLAVNRAANPVRVFPNPWKSTLHTNAPVTFDALPPNATIKLFTASGHLVKTLETSSTRATWDRTNEAGDKVASGVYLYLVTDVLGNETSGKLAIVK